MAAALGVTARWLETAGLLAAVEVTPVEAWLAEHGV
jgi:hypothetical protein